MKVNRNTIYLLALLSLILLCQIPTTLARDDESSEEEQEPDSEEMKPLTDCIESIYNSLESYDRKLVLNHQKFLLKLAMRTVDFNGSYTFDRRLDANEIENELSEQGFD